MLLSNLNKKEKLKFLDLAIHMVSVDGEANANEERILNIMLAEVGDNIIDEYTFTLSSNVNETIDFFVKQAKPVRNIVFLNLLSITMRANIYNTSEHFFLDNIRRQFKISLTKKKELMALLYDERDLKEKAKRACLE